MSLLDNFQAAVARVESCRSKLNDLQQKRDELDRELYHLEQDMAREADARDKLKLIIDSKLDQCSAPAAPEPLPTVDTSGWTLPKKEEEKKAPKAKPLKRERASRVREGTLIHSVLCTIRDYGPMSAAEACKQWETS